MKRILIILSLTALLFACDVLPDAPPTNTNPADPENPESLYSPVNLPTAGGVSFFDTNTAEDIIEGTMTIAKAADETAVTGYRLYWSADGTTKLNNAPVVKDVVKTGSDIILTFGTETGNLITSVPVGATHLLIYTYYGDYEAETLYAYDIQDRVVEMVVDLFPNSPSSLVHDLTLFNDKLYFVAQITDDTFPYGAYYNLWEYANTKAVDLTNSNENLRNPRMVPVNGLLGFSNPFDLQIVNDKLYFVADCDAATNDNQICYITSSGGYIHVTNTADLIPLGTTYMVYFNEGSSNYIFFNGYNSSIGQELFRTANITPPSSNYYNVANIYTGINNSSPAWLTVHDNTLYFSANGGTYGTELWSYDGTANPTVGVDIKRVTDIAGGVESSSPEHLTVYNGDLYFSAYNLSDTELWCFDGTTATEIDVSTRTNGSTPTFPVEYNGDLYFQAYDDDGTNRLWKYNGTGSPEAILFPEDARTTNGDAMFVFDDMLYFTGFDADHGQEPWCYDGTSAYRLADINSNGTSGSLSTPSFASHNGRLYFAANDGAWGTELWTYYVK